MKRIQVFYPDGAPATAIEKLQSYDIAHDNYMRSVADSSIQELCNLYERDLTEIVLRAIQIIVKTGNPVIINYNTLSIFKNPYIVKNESYPIQLVHYGDIKGINDSPSTTASLYAKHGILHPFKRLQLLFKEKGYYLQDISTKMDRIIVGPVIVSPRIYMKDISPLYYYNYHTNKCDDIYCNYKKVCTKTCGRYYYHNTLWHGLDIIPQV